MRGYTDTDPRDEYTRITNLQNQGVSCPYCQADAGHFGSCPVLHRYEAQAQHSVTGGYAQSQADGISESELQTVNIYRDDPLTDSLTEKDIEFLKGLKIKTTEN